MNPSLTLSEIQKKLRKGETTCFDITTYFINKIKQNKHLNAFLEVFEEEAVEQAKTLDEKRNNEQSLGLLHGLVIGIKDNICYKNHTLSAASKMLENFESIFSATAVEKLIAEDAIIIGRLNCDEFAMGSSNENSAFGNALNPIDNNRSPGGSSGGSAVAVSAGLCHASLGSDTGGSIRQPAAFCGSIGLKPTYGRVSRHGLIAFASSFDQIGPITHNIENAQAILSVISGKDHFDSTSSSKPLPSPKVINRNKPYKIAYFKSIAQDSSEIQNDIKVEYLRTIENLKTKGHAVEAIDFPYQDYVVPAYYILTTAEASSNLSRYDGVHYGYRSPAAKNMEDVYTLSRTEGFGKEVKNRIMLGTFVLSAGYYDAYYSKAQKVRRILKNFFNGVYENYDAILTPTTPTTAFKLGEKTKNPVEMYLADIFTVTANLVGNPAISLPVGKDKKGLPIGMQLMANDFNEENLLDLSKTLM